MSNAIGWDNGPPVSALRKSTWGLMGQDAHASGKRWGQKMKTQCTQEEIKSFIRRLGNPKNDHDRGVLEGLQ